MNEKWKYTSRTEKNTPTLKIKINIEKSAKIGDKRPQVVIIGSGAFNPIHRKHIGGIFGQVRDYLETKKKMNVVGGYILLDNDEYVLGKYTRKNCSEYFIPSKIRIKIAELSVKESNCSDFLEVDRWGIEQHVEYPDWISFLEATNSLRIFLKGKFPKEDIRVLYTCGTDQFWGDMKIRDCDLKKNDVFVCVLRRSHKDPIRQENVIDIDNLIDLSSTEVVSIIQKTNNLEELKKKLEKYIFTSAMEELLRYFSRN